eukprot:RCo047622
MRITAKSTAPMMGRQDRREVLNSATKPVEFPQEHIRVSTQGVCCRGEGVEDVAAARPCGGGPPADIFHLRTAPTAVLLETIAKKISDSNRQIQRWYEKM